MYGRITEGRILVPEVKEIRRLAPEPVEPLGSKKRKRSTRSKSKAPAEYPDPNPEKGWDDETNTHCEVLGYPDGQPRMRREFCTFGFHVWLTYSSRYRMYGTNGECPAGCKQQLVLRKDLRRWEFHGCWTDAYSTAKSKDI